MIVARSIAEEGLSISRVYHCLICSLSVKANSVQLSRTIGHYDLVFSLCYKVVPNVHISWLSFTLLTATMLL